MTRWNVWRREDVGPPVFERDFPYEALARAWILTRKAPADYFIQRNDRA